MNQQSERRAQPEHDAQHDPAHPTATAPESVEHSVYEQAEYAGKQGPDANDPPEAAKKSEGAGVGSDPAPDLDGEPRLWRDALAARPPAHRAARSRGPRGFCFLRSRA